MIGGVGIAEEWTGDAQDPDHWRDTHVRVRGPVVRGLQGAFAENWLEATGDVLVGDGYLPDLEPRRRTAGRCSSCARAPASATRTSRRCTSSRSPAPGETLDLTAAYFAPRPAFVEALCDARASAACASRVLVPGPHIDKPFVRHGRPARPTTRLLDAGVEVYEYQPTMLHAKTLCIDGVWSVDRLGELRQPLVPAERRGDAVRAVRARSRAS